VVEAACAFEEEEEATIDERGSTGDEDSKPVSDWNIVFSAAEENASNRRL